MGKIIHMVILDSDLSAPAIEVVENHVQLAFQVRWLEENRGFQLHPNGVQWFRQRSLEDEHTYTQRVHFVTQAGDILTHTEVRFLVQGGE
jgi:hypothetical protein